MKNNYQHGFFCCFFNAVGDFYVGAVSKTKKAPVLPMPISWS
jgi:hypothetical protein